MKIDELGLTENDYINIDVNSERFMLLDDLPNEVWKDIVDFENYYQVSNYGRVKSLGRQHLVCNQVGCTGNYKQIKERILVQNKTKKGYYLVWLYKNGKRKGISSHILVANAFIPNTNNLDTVNHIKPVNKCSCDNRLINLEYMSLRENIIDSIKRGTHKYWGRDLHDKNNTL